MPSANSRGKIGTAMDCWNTRRSFAAIQARKTVFTGKRKRAKRKVLSVCLSLRQEARAYGPNKTSDKPTPYRGYYYRILTAQGKNAAGGAYSYIVKGKMIGGFALVGYPAEYGNSGLMTFIVNHDGKVFQKDLGKNTPATAMAMKEFNPDSSWTAVRE
jgi:hypothetical protein